MGFYSFRAESQETRDVLNFRFIKHDFPLPTRAFGNSISVSWCLYQRLVRLKSQQKGPTGSQKGPVLLELKRVHLLTIKKIYLNQRFQMLRGKICMKQQILVRDYRVCFTVKVRVVLFSSTV